MLTEKSKAMVEKQGASLDEMILELMNRLSFYEGRDSMSEENKDLMKRVAFLEAKLDP